MPVYLAAGSTALAGADFTVVAGTPQTLALFQASGDNVGAQYGVDFEVQKKNSNATYTLVFVLNSANHPKQITAPGTYRVRRLLSAASAGLDKD